MDRKFFSDDKTHFGWHDTYDFDGDMSNHPDFPAGFRPEYKLSGIRTDAIFRAPGVGDLTLRADSPGRHAARAMAIEMPDGEIVHPPAGGHVGALQEDGRPFGALRYRRFPGAARA